jgi:hypothetical protein
MVRADRRNLMVLAALVLVGVACASGARSPELRPPPRQWQVQAPQHVALWYHGLALLEAADTAAIGAANPEIGEATSGGSAGAAIADHRSASRDAGDATTLPGYAGDYAEQARSARAHTGLDPTPLEQRAAELGHRLREETTFRELELLPLHFSDARELFAALRTWNAVDGDESRVRQSSVPAVRYLLEQESQVFHDAYWQGHRAEREAAIAAVSAEWDQLAPELVTLRAYLQLPGGNLLLVPAVGAAGRLLTRGPGSPAIIVQAPPAGQAQNAMWSMLQQFFRVLADDVVHEYVAPARIRRLGEEQLISGVAVHAGAIFMDRYRPEQAAAYRRYFVDAAGRSRPIADLELDAELERLFPLDPELREGLGSALDRALAGI